TADTQEIRRAYLRQARANHPDFASSQEGSAHLGADERAERMRMVNAAWHVLGDSERRLDYDRELRSIPQRSSTGVPNGASFSASASGEARPSRISRPSSDFTPYSVTDEDDDDSWRYEPDVGDPATVPPKILLAAPAFLFMAGIGLLAASAPTEIRALTALGAIALILSALLFVGAPVVALFKSQLAEQQAERRNTRR
ncbi:MAG TPA: DnaJ domain-containing protein, partial [Microthrixaceae bacterium]|nr:DnaJ domain-containing protein [Microthrixaceae bacterium]